MKPFTIELDDRAVSLARAGTVLASAASVIFDGGSAELAGTNAWHALRSHPTVTSSRHLELALTQPEATDRTLSLVVADLARRVAAIKPQEGERVWIASPAFADPRALGNVLGILRALSLPIDGFVDSAVATVAALDVRPSTIVVELGLHHVAATALDVGSGMVRRRRSVVSERGGLLELYQAWIEFISTAFVKRTRFDPRHDAATEQQLFDAIGGLVRDIAAGGSARAIVSRGADAFEVELSQDQFALAAHSLRRELLRLVHELRPAGAPVSLAFPSAALGIPGLRADLAQFVGCELLSLADGFAAAALSAVDFPERRAEQPSQLLRRLPQLTHGSLADKLFGERLEVRKSGAASPTHVLFDGRALALDADAMVIGRAPGEARSITLADGLAGVSRRHCTFVRDGSEVVLLDHSSFGTFVNGERVAERVRLYAGDRVRLGEPGVELALIAVGEAAAPAP